MPEEEERKPRTTDPIELRRLLDVNERMVEELTQQLQTAEADIVQITQKLARAEAEIARLNSALISEKEHAAAGWARVRELEAAKPS